MFQKDPLLLNDFKQSTMTIKNPITIENQHKSCIGRPLDIQQSEINSFNVSTLLTEPQYSLPVYGSAAVSNRSLVNQSCQIVEKPSTHPLAVALSTNMSHLGMLPPVPPCFTDPLLCHDVCEESKLLLQSTPYCVTRVESLSCVPPFTGNPSIPAQSDLAGSSTTYTQLNEPHGRNMFPEILELNSGTSTTRQLFNSQKVGSISTEVSSGKSSSNMVTNTTAIGSVNTGSSSGSLGMTEAHCPSSQFSAPGSDLFANLQWNGSCEIQESDAVLSTILNKNGGLLGISRSGVYLKVPKDATGESSETRMYLAICRDERKRPNLRDHQTLLSPVVQFGSEPVHLKQPVILSFPHCANLNEGSWCLRIFAHSKRIASNFQDNERNKSGNYDFNPSQNDYEQEENGFREESPASADWKEICTIASEKNQCKIVKSLQGITCQVNASEVHLITHYPQRYCLIGETLTPTSEYQTTDTENHNLAIKMLRLAAYSTRPTPSMDYNIRVYILPDILDALEHVKTVELLLDGYLLDTTGPLPFYDTGQGMCFSIEEVSRGWRSRLHLNTQEVPFRHIWGGTQLPTLHCAFTLEHIDHTQTSVSCRIIAFQGLNWEHNSVLEIANDCIENPHINTNSIPVATSRMPLTYYCIQSSAREMICVLMNHQQKWHDLAKRMNFDGHITHLIGSANPTEALLNLWEATHRQDQYLGNLKDIFHQLGQSDCAKLLVYEQETYWDAQ